MPSLEEIHKKDLLQNLQQDYARLSRYVMFELRWVYYDEIRGVKSDKVNEPYGSSPDDANVNAMTREQMVLEILYNRYGVEDTKWALEKLKIELSA